MANLGGKTYCPACGASSNKPDFGRDGSPRVASGARQALSEDPVIVKRRAHAKRLRLKNG